jgi:hypothetical protein
MGRKLGGNGEGEVSLRATWDQGGRDRITPKEGFQVSKRDLRKGKNWQRGMAKGISEGSKKGIAPRSKLLICVYVSYHCMNATNKRMCLGYK